jgi:hypothetical protein
MKEKCFGNEDDRKENMEQEMMANFIKLFTLVIYEFITGKEREKYVSLDGRVGVGCLSRAQFHKTFYSCNLLMFVIS